MPDSRCEGGSHLLSPVVRVPEEALLVEEHLFSAQYADSLPHIACIQVVSGLIVHEAKPPGTPYFF